MKLFKSKESCKDKSIKNRISIKNVEFCRKTSKFLPERCLFIFCSFFYLNEKELNQHICLIKYVENEISNSTSHTHTQKKLQKKISNFKNFSKTPEFSLVTLVTNYHKLSLFPLVVRP